MTLAQCIARFEAADAARPAGSLIRLHRVVPNYSTRRQVNGRFERVLIGVVHLQHPDPDRRTDKAISKRLGVSVGTIFETSEVPS